VTKGRRVLVTGGAGFIGTALARAHAHDVDRWVAVDNLLPQVHGDQPDPVVASYAELVTADVRDPDAMAWLVADVRPDVIVHLAAETGTGQSLDEPARHTDVNVTGTARLVEALNAAQVLPRKIVLTSSRAVYGEGAWCDASGHIAHPATRGLGQLQQGQWDFQGLSPLPSSVPQTAVLPSNVYGATKLAQEHLLRAWAPVHGVGLGILRLQNVYGPGQSPINPYTGITTLFCRIARDRGEIPVYEDGNIGRDFVYIDDVERAIWLVASQDQDAVVDVGSGVRTTLLKLAQTIAAIAGAPAPVVTGQYRLGDVRDASCSMAASQRVLGDLPVTALTDGLTRLYAWLAGDAAAVTPAPSPAAP
jgi:dTDP-L-rhamnose 4-epimerase